MNIDMLRIGSRGVTLVLSTIRSCSMCYYQTGGCLFSPVRYHHRASSLPVIGDDLPVIVPKHKWGIQIERSGVDYASQVYCRAFLYEALLGAEYASVWLDNSEVHSVLQMRRGWHLAAVPTLVSQGDRLQYQAPLVAPSVVMNLEIKIDKEIETRFLFLQILNLYDNLEYNLWIIKMYNLTLFSYFRYFTWRDI